MKTMIKKSAGIVAVLAIAVSAAFLPMGTVSAQSSIQDGINASQAEGVPSKLFGDDSIFTTIVNILLFVIGAISVIMLIWGGIRYTTSGGSSGAVSSAKNTIMYAIIGLVVAFLAYAIVNWVLGAVGNGTTTQ